MRVRVCGKQPTKCKRIVLAAAAKVAKRGLLLLKMAAQFFKEETHFSVGFLVFLLRLGENGRGSGTHFRTIGLEAPVAHAVGVTPTSL